MEKIEDNEKLIEFGGSDNYKYVKTTKREYEVNESTINELWFKWVTAKGIKFGHHRGADFTIFVYKEPINLNKDVLRQIQS